MRFFLPRIPYPLWHDDNVRHVESATVADCRLVTLFGPAGTFQESIDYHAGAGAGQHPLELGAENMTTCEPPDGLNQSRVLVAEIDGELTKRDDPKTVLEQMRKSALA